MPGSHGSVNLKSDGVDYAAEGLAVEVKLLRALVMGSRQSDEIQLLLDSQALGKADYQGLALTLTDHSVNENRARATFEGLKRHQLRLQASLARAVGVKTAAMDYLENMERALDLPPQEQSLSYNQLARMAFNDYLTGLPNYRYFTTRYAEEFKRAQRYHHLVSLLLLDIDHFKRFNDSFGHPAGNQALEHLADILRTQVRETDLCGRYGGEEFAIILPETTKQEACELAERIRQAIEAKPVALEEAGAQRLTVSLGVATFPRDAHDPDELLRATDEALYAAKHGGRNRISGYAPPTRAEVTYKAPAARTVSLVGDFNGWNRNAEPMKMDAEGVWRLQVPLAAGKYSYKFFVDGERFLQDPQCAETAPDDFGNVNSVLTVAA